MTSNPWSKIFAEKMLNSGMKGKEFSRIQSHRFPETRINLLFQFDPEKLGRFEKTLPQITSFKGFLFFPIRPIAKFVRSPVVYG